jgi:hypothetical protein
MENKPMRHLRDKVTVRRGSGRIETGIIQAELPEWRKFPKTWGVQFEPSKLLEWVTEEQFIEEQLTFNLI